MSGGFSFIFNFKLMKPLPLLQSEYLNAQASLQTAKNFVAVKCRNMSELLKSYVYYRKKYYPDQANELNKIIAKILQEISNINLSGSISSLMLTEARASRRYWRGFTLLCKCPAKWTRVHPQALDPWNLSLNIGYTMLGNLLRPALQKFAFSLEIGILHAPRKNREVLLYDFQELFRQPLIDAGLISLFARTRPEKIENKNIVKKIARRFVEPFRYQGKLVRLSTVIESELREFVKALGQKKPYAPYQYSWSHFNKKKSRFLN